MSAQLNPTISNRLLRIFTIIFMLLQVGCTYGPSSRPENERWTELTTLVDGVIEIQFSLPMPNQRQEIWENKTSFVGSRANEFSNLFILGSDQGYGGLSGADIVSFYGSVYRVQKQNGFSQLSFEDFYQTLKLSRPKVMSDRRYIGKETIGGKEWYKVDYFGKYPADSSIYYHLMGNNYVLIISIKVFGENANETKLYKQRYSDLKKILASVKITVADFATHSERPIN